MIIYLCRSVLTPLLKYFYILFISDSRPYIHHKRLKSDKKMIKRVKI